MNNDIERVRTEVAAGRLGPERWAEVKKKAKGGDPEALYLLALDPRLKRKGRQARLWEASYSGHKDAYFELHGRHLDELHEQAEAGDADAQYSLGIYYGTLKSPDHRKMRHWYMQSALQGCETSMYEIALTLFLGEGGPAEPVEGLAWMEKAAMHRSWASEARKILVDVLETGLHDVPIDLERAEYWRALPDLEGDWDD